MTVAVSQPPEPELYKPKLRRWTVEEYLRPEEMQLLQGKGRAILLNGEIVLTSRLDHPNCVAIELAARALQDVFPRGAYWVRQQAPMDLDDGRSNPRPDVSVLVGKIEDNYEVPTTAPLVVEVADESLPLEWLKTAYYAAAKVPDYWIVNLRDRVLEVYRDPTSGDDPWQPDGPPLARYHTTQVLKPGDAISPVAAPAATVAVADLFPARPPGDTF